MRARLDQHGAAVHHRVAVVPHAVFRRHVVIGHAGFRQHGADPDLVAIGVGGAPLLDHVAAEARTLLDAEHAGDAANDTANRAAYNGAHRAGRALALPGTAFDASGHALRLGEVGKCD